MATLCARGFFFFFFFFFFGEARESEIAKKLFLAFSSSPEKKPLTPRVGNGQFTVYFSV